MATRAKVETFTESFQFTEGMKPDRESGLLPGVKILGPKSKNGRTYTEAAMRKAIPLYEGAKVNFDHPDKPNGSRKYGERFGKLESVEYRAGANGGLFGNLRFNPKHALAEQFCWDAENSPDSCGLSHNVQGKTKGKAGSLVVEDIAKVTAVDVVADPASTNSLREHEEQDDVTLSEIIESLEGNQSRAYSLLEAFVGQMPAMGQMQVPGAGPMGQMGQPQVNQHLKAALKAAINALMDDESLSLDEVIELIKSKAGTSAEADPENPGGNPMADPEKKPAEGEGKEPEKKKPPVEESVKAAIDEALKPITESLSATTKELDARKVLESKGAMPNAQLIDELLECADKAAMEKLVEGWSPMKLGRKKPAIGGIRESVGEYPKDHDDFVRQMKRR